MAYIPSHYGTGFGYSGFPSYSFPTTFAGQPQFAVADRASQAADGSQAGDEQAAASQHVASVSGFGADPALWGYGGFAHHGATFVQPQHTLLGGAQFYGQPSFVPVAAPQVRRPGYNERLVAWRNRQKAFNRYKKATKEAIKNANQAHYHQQQTVLAGAAPSWSPYGAYAPWGYGSTFLPAGAVFAQDQGIAEAQEGQYGDFTSYSSAGAAQQEAQQEEPEIRGTQV